MTKRFLYTIIGILFVTNIITLLFNNGGDSPEVIEDENTEINTKQPVASVNGEEIPYEQWMASLREGYGKQQLKKIVDQTIVEQLAADKNLSVDEKIIERELALLASMQGGLSEEEAEKLEVNWREDIKHRYLLEALLTEDVSISETEVRDYYNQYQNQYDFSESMQFSHIIVNDLSTAEKVKEELDSGASFSLLAREYSIDEDTKDVGGYAGYFTVNSQFLPSGYHEEAMEMEDYTYSEPFLTDRGYAIMYLHRYFPEITFTYEELAPYIENELALEASEQSLIADPLWDTVDVEWLYD